MNPVSRRRFLEHATLAAAAAAPLAAWARQQPAGAAPTPKPAPPIVLPPLPWDEGALAPYISAQTVGVHYGKHHKGYVDNLNRLKQGTDLAEASLEEIVKASFGKPERKALFNNAAQVWNHTFYWKSLTPKSAGRPGGKLKQQLESDFGGFDKFREAYAAAAVTQFGSGWAWLVLEAGKLKVLQTSNADTPLATGQVPLLTVDVWEHAYYLDYQNRRADYVNTCLDKLLNWDFAQENFEKAVA